MPITTPELFEVDGLSLRSNVIIVAGAINPQFVGYVAPIGSMYLCTNGETWKKIGALDTDWALDTSGGSIDGSLYVLNTRSIQKEDDYLVEVDVGCVSFNHYYEDGIECSLDSPNYYQHDVTIKNLSGNPITIKPLHGRIDGKHSFSITNKYASLTLKPVALNWVIVSQVEGKKVTLEKCDYPV
jgi:hypothetical protein